ncbi:MAG: DUF3343 domain-containing protein [Clostridia bacterium]|nr:DUF3343 domain-containing protein [Clostridia bacterium]
MQDYVLVILSSVTYAKRVEQLLERSGITCAIGHTPKRIAKKGCSYMVKVKRADLPALLKITDELMLKIHGIYRKKGDADYDLLG